jgi:peroxiredoxin
MGIGAGAVLSGLDLMAEMKVPKPAPELVLALNSGEQLLLSKFRGKVVVLEFLLTTCPHCQRCSAVMQKVQNDMGGEKAFVALGAAVNPNDMTEARMLIPSYVYNLGLKVPVGYAKREMAYQWLEATGPGANLYFPQLVFIDKKGIIREYRPATQEEWFKNEEANIRKSVEALMKEGPGVAGAPASSKKKG